MSFDKNNTSTESHWEKLKNKSEDLARKIAIEFQISFEKTRELINSESVQSLSKLKKEFSHLDNSRIQKLFEQISEAKKNEKQNINEFSKDKISSLLDELSKVEDIQICNTVTLENTFWEKSLNIAQNPTKPHHHIHGWAMWFANSCINTGECITSIWKGIINTPADLYLLVTWKAELPEYNI